MFRKGADESASIPPLLASAVLVMTALVLSQGMAEGAFSTINQRNNRDFIQDNIIENIKTACKTSGKKTFPRRSNYSFKLNGVNDIKIERKRTVIDNFYNFHINYSGNTEKFRIDKNGIAGNWMCSDGSGSGVYQLNGSLAGGQTNSWVEVDSDEPIKWRVMEEKDNKWLNVQVSQ